MEANATVSSENSVTKPRNAASPSCTVFYITKATQKNLEFVRNDLQNPLLTKLRLLADKVEIRRKVDQNSWKLNIECGESSYRTDWFFLEYCSIRNSYHEWEYPWKPGSSE